jgi:peroxiredoxin
MAVLSSRVSNLGSPAPPLELSTATGEQRSLAQFRGRPVMVSFLGPPHCVFCRAHIIKLIQAQRDIAAADAEVLMVACHDPSRIMEGLFHDLQVPFTLLLDPHKTSYTRWGIGVGSWWQYLRPGLYWAYYTQKLKGGTVVNTPPNPYQLGGDFVVDRHGRLAFAHQMKTFYDRAPVARLLEAVQAIA